MIGFRQVRFICLLYTEKQCIKLWDKPRKHIGEIHYCIEGQRSAPSLIASIKQNRENRTETPLTFGNIVRFPLPALGIPNLDHVEQHPKPHCHVNRGLVLNKDIDEQFIRFRFAVQWNAKYEIGLLFSKVVRNKTPVNL